MFGRDADGRNVTRVIGFQQPDSKTGHRTVLRNHPVGHGLRRAEKVFERIAAVGFAVGKAALIEMPAFVHLSDG